MRRALVTGGAQFVGSHLCERLLSEGYHVLCMDNLRTGSFQYGLPSVALRYANVYGPRQNPHGEASVVAIFCANLAADETSTINGTGVQTRDYI
jgi:nucleoside-diphosphate-sugar epimerase